MKGWLINKKGEVGSQNSSSVIRFKEEAENASISLLVYKPFIDPVVGCMLRKGKEGEFKANYSLGGRFLLHLRSKLFSMICMTGKFGYIKYNLKDYRTYNKTS